MSLKDKKCLPCEGGVAPLSSNQIEEYLPQLEKEWSVLENKKIQFCFVFKNFLEAMKFVNEVADVAEHEAHHPDIIIHYNQVTIELWTHAIDGLSENDFIVASKIEELL